MRGKVPEVKSGLSAPLQDKTEARIERRLRSQEWTSRAIESGSFATYQVGIIHDWLRTLTLLAAALVPTFFVLDAFVVPAPLLLRFGLYRVLSSCLATVQFFIVLMTRPSRWSYVHGYVISAQVGGIIALMTATLGGFSSSYYAGLNLVVIGVNLLMPWRAFHTAINAALILAMYVAFNVAAGHPYELTALLNNLFFLGATAVIAAAINFVRFRLLQNEFTLLVEVRRGRDELQGEKDLVEERTRSLKSLLDVSGQGFLSFDKDFIVSPEYSHECESILGPSLEGRKIDELLYENSRSREDFRNGLRLYFNGTSRADVIFDILDQRLRIREKVVRAEYKAVHPERVMMVLTDITEETRLQEESRRENERKATLLKVISNRNVFGAFNREARSLFARLTDPRDGYESIARELHSFKANAGFLGFLGTQEAAHELEDFLVDRLALEQAIMPGEKIVSLINAFTEELSIITESLGSSWLEDADSVEVPRSELQALESHVRTHYPGDRVLRSALEGYKKKPLSALFDRFPQMTAELAARMGKRVLPLVVKGGDILVPEDHYQEMIGSFSHLVRNMVDHGIESPGEREAKGKAPEGTITIDITRSDHQLVFTFADDGRGVQLDKVEQRARKLGLLKDGQEASPRDLLALIFTDNFSTSSTVSHVSGRGVGLAAVREAVRKMGGRITVKSAVDRGTVFTVTVPRAAEGEAVA